MTASARCVWYTLREAAEQNADRDGNAFAFGGAGLIAAAAVSRSTFWIAVRRLEAAGYLVLLARGGVRIRTSVGLQVTANLYGLPAERGALDDRRLARAMVYRALGSDGRMALHRAAPGEQLVMMHDGAERAVRKAGRAARMPRVTIEGLRDGPAFWDLYTAFCEAGIVKHCEYHQFQFAAEAERVLRLARDGRVDPVKVFAANARAGRWSFASIEDQERGRRRVNRLLVG